VWFRATSTWDGVAGIYLEDPTSGPAFRRRGLARKLLSALAAECVEHGYARRVGGLNWNVNAIALYDAVGGKPQTEWTTYRVSGRSCGPGPRLIDRESATICRIRGAQMTQGRTLATESVPRHPLHGGRAEQQPEHHQRGDATRAAYSGWPDPWMYQATPSSSRLANTATPLPQRRPVISAQPAARIAPPMRANHAAVL
jgi:hypothetical protein